MKNKILLLVILLLALLGLGAAAIQAQAARTAETAPQSPPLDPALQASLQEKAAMAARIEADRAAGKQKAASKQSGLPPEISAGLANTSVDPLTAGIFEGGSAVIHGWQAQILNHWQDLPDGQLTQVYAGSLADDPQQGVLFVVRWVEGVPHITQHLLPSRDGAARILAVEEALLLRVETPGGSSWLFDWRSGEFR